MPQAEKLTGTERLRSGFYPLPIEFGISTCDLQTQTYESDLSRYAREHFPKKGLTPYEVNPHHDLHEETDLRLLAESGARHYRISVEWAKLFPNDPQTLNRAAVEEYKRYIKHCQELGLTVYVTLSHFAAPVWLAENGGWKKIGTAFHFQRFVEAFLDEISPSLPPGTVINIMNEPATLAAMILGGKSEDNSQKSTRELFFEAHELADNLLFCIRRAEFSINKYNRKHGARFETTSSHQISPIYPIDPDNPFDHFAAWLANYWQNTLLLKKLRGSLCAIQFYRPAAVGLIPISHNHEIEEIGDGKSNENEFFCFRVTADGVGIPEFKALNGWAFPRPQDLLLSLQMAHKYHPDQEIVIFEEGYPGILKPEKFKDAEDEAYWTRKDELARILHLLITHLTVFAARQLHGLPVKGIFHWTLIDNNELGRPQDRFGLVAWDPETDKRTPRSVYHVFQKICRDRGIDLPGIYQLLENLGILSKSDVHYLKLHLRLALRDLGLPRPNQILFPNETP